ncbi:MAG: cytochrome c [Phyllobacteriaceae bacterium]|nr:cytochrome c [Phyllobacteriaceae bacterium]
MKKLLLALPLLALTSTATLADPYADRTAIMKSFGEAMKVLVPTVKGEAAYDAAAVAAALGKIGEGAAKIDVAALFPAGSNTGESIASPKIWENMADFTARMDKFKAAAAAAATANPADVEAFKATFGPLAGNCGECHENYRIKKG